jgi:predicted nucleic-acid-binding protein
MIALDTNILARYLLADDADQAERATQLIESHQCFVPVTVGLELAWVLSSQKISKVDILSAFGSLLLIESLTWQCADAWQQAILWAGAGMDLADALHVALAPSCDVFYSFDQKFIARAGREGVRPACVLPRPI